MTIEGPSRRLTIYVGSQDTHHGRNLGAAIVECCRARGMAGATLTRGLMGFGQNSTVHRAHFLGLSDDLPERIEVIDLPDRIDAILPEIEAMIGGGLIVVEDVEVLRHRGT